MLGRCFLIQLCRFSGKSNFQSYKKEFGFNSFSSKITKLQCFLLIKWCRLHHNDNQVNILFFPVKFACVPVCLITGRLGRFVKLVMQELLLKCKKKTQTRLFIVLYLG